MVTLAALLYAARANSDTGAPTDEEPRTELAALPVASGSSDIGVQLGGAGFLTRLAPNARPYVWKTDLLLSFSVKPGPEGLEVAQQAHDLRFDSPRFLGSPVRVMSGLFFERQVNAGYFGLGNAAPAIPLSDGTFGRRYQSITEEVRARINTRFPFWGPLDAMLGLQLRYSD